MTDTEKLDHLETWATLAAEALQDVIDDARRADPDNPAPCPELAMMINDLDRILGTDWQSQLVARGELAKLGEL